MQEKYKVYYRNPNGKLGVTEVSEVNTHVEAVAAVKSAYRLVGAVLAVITGGKSAI